jgi:uncharacterized surface protein with fasciclin (FAS1) repeats
MTGYLKSVMAGVFSLAIISATGISTSYAGNYGSTMSKADIVDTAIAAGSFNTLVTAVQAAGLVDTLKGEGPFTVFAPTDEAFAKIPKANLEALLADKEALTAVLTYHVVPGRVTSKELVAARYMTVKTVEGETVAIDARISVTVNNANVVKADIDASNGIIHVIDTVLMPTSMTSALDSKLRVAANTVD